MGDCDYYISIGGSIHNREEESSSDVFLKGRVIELQKSYGEHNYSEEIVSNLKYSTYCECYQEAGVRIYIVIKQQPQWT